MIISSLKFKNLIEIQKKEKKKRKITLNKLKINHLRVKPSNINNPLKNLQLMRQMKWLNNRKYSFAIA